MRKIIVFATLTLSLLAVPMAQANDRGGQVAGDNLGSDRCVVTDRASVCAEASDRPVERPTAAVTDRPTNRVTDARTRPGTDRPRDRVTDRPRDPVTDQPHWKQTLRRCLHHHPDAQIPPHMTDRELWRLLHRCLYHHRHHDLPL